MGNNVLHFFGPLRHLSTRQILVATRPIPSVILTARVSFTWYGSNLQCIPSGYIIRLDLPSRSMMQEVNTLIEVWQSQSSRWRLVRGEDVLWVSWWGASSCQQCGHSLFQGPCRRGRGHGGGRPHEHQGGFLQILRQWQHCPIHPFCSHVNPRDHSKAKAVLRQLLVGEHSMSSPSSFHPMWRGLCHLVQERVSLLLTPFHWFFPTTSPHYSILSLVYSYFPLKNHLKGYLGRLVGVGVVSQSGFQSILSAGMSTNPDWTSFLRCRTDESSQAELT